MKRIIPQSLRLILVCTGFWVWQAAPLSQSMAQTGPTSHQDVKVLFDKRCASCHGKDGQAKTFKAKFNKARNLTDAAWQASVNDERLFNSIANGRGKMPAYLKKLSEAEINALVAHVRQLKK